MRVRLLAAVAVVTVVAAGGCTVPSAGTPLPASTQAPTSNTDGDLPTNGAPKVENPLDASHFEKHPCDVLEPEAAETLNLPPDGEQEGIPTGETCLWFNDSTRGSLVVTFFSTDKDGLSSVYREARASGWPYFERIDDVEEHPAVAASIKEDPPKYGCVIFVGLTDQLAFSVDVSLSDANVGKSDPCPVAAKAAGMMVRTMREAA